MTIKQISIFLENRKGRINDVTKVLAQAGINMEAFCIAETADFGLMRLIVSEVDKAVDVLRAADFAVIVTDVIPAILRLPGPGIPPAAPVVWIYFTEDGFPESVLCETETSVYGTVRPFQIGITHNIVRMDVPDEFSEQFSHAACHSGTVFRCVPHPFV